MTDLPPEVAALVDTLDNLVRMTGVGPMTVPALSALVGRYVAYESGSPERIKDGLDIAWAMMRRAAIDEAARLYA